MTPNKDAQEMSDNEIKAAIKEIERRDVRLDRKAWNTIKDAALGFAGVRNRMNQCIKENDKLRAEIAGRKEPESVTVDEFEDVIYPVLFKTFYNEARCIVDDGYRIAEAIAKRFTSGLIIVPQPPTDLKE